MTRNAAVAQQFQEIVQKVNLAEADGKLSEAQIERGKKIAEKIEEAMR